MSSCVAVISTGSSASSSRYFRTRTMPRILFRGQIEGIGVGPLRVRGRRRKTLDERIALFPGFDRAATREKYRHRCAVVPEIPVWALDTASFTAACDSPPPVRLDLDVLDELARLNHHNRCIGP